MLLALTVLAASSRADQALESVVVGKTNSAFLQDEMDKVSYSFGMSVGTGLKSVPNLRSNAFVTGVFDVLYGKQTLVSETERDEILKKFDEFMQLRHTAEMSAQADKNKTDGETFLAENAKKEGVKVLPSGLQYKIITAGSGPSPKADDSVTIHYRGTLVNGQEFDSSYARKIPNTVPIRSVIKGWSEALQLMNPGSKWQLFVPAELGYGRNTGIKEIPADSALIYEIELLSIAGQSPSATQASTK